MASDAQRQEDVLRAVGAGATVAAAAAAAAVPASMLERWMQRGTFSARLRQAIGRSEVLHTARVAQAAARGDARAATALMEALGTELLRLDLEAAMARDDDQ